jgi:carboxypeptidase Taq
LSRFTAETITAAVNRVTPSFIRVEADEVTYDLHIMLRFEIETRLVEESIPPEDVPAIWNEEFKKLLGLDVPDDARGCLQDIHWSLGTLGYFPTYSLGNLNASQLMHTVRREHPHLDAELERGHYATLLGWLREKIHFQGQRFEPVDLMRFATGDATTARHHLGYLRHKFSV